MKTRDAALLVGAAALASRLPWLCPVEQDLDGSRFVRALMRFDLAQGHPHPPGYPLLVLLGRVAMRAVGDPSHALSLVSAVAFAVTASSAFTIAWRATRSRPTAYLAALAFALGTCATVQSTRPLSDMLGCALAWSTLRLAESPSRNGFHGALIGMLAAARPSALPITLVGAIRRGRGNLRSALTLASSCALTTLMLYAPAVWSVGVTRFASLVTEHAEGHFTRFGGSVVTRPDLFERARAFAFGLHAHLLGGWWTDRPRWLLPATVATWALLLVGAARARSVKLLRGPLASCAVYAAWVFFGQNVVWQPRHLLPLAPAVAILVALGFRRCASARDGSPSHSRSSRSRPLRSSRRGCFERSRTCARRRCASSTRSSGAVTPRARSWRRGSSRRGYASARRGIAWSRCATSTRRSRSRVATA